MYVVGGGISGLTSALRLAQRGYNVTIFEEKEQIGGNLAGLESGGNHYDVYPHMYGEWYHNFWNMVEGDLGRHRAELSRLDLAVENLETTWLFLARDDGSLVMDPSSPASAAALQMRIIEAQEAERSRLAQEIHDGPAQALTNAIFQVQYVDRLLDQDPVVAGVELRYLGELLRRELSDVRSYISQLRPPLLDQLGLEGAIRDTVEKEFGPTGHGHTPTPMPGRGGN